MFRTNQDLTYTQFCVCVSKYNKIFPDNLVRLRVQGHGEDYKLGCEYSCHSDRLIGVNDVSLTL